MAENSNIEWTDHTFNPWIGCTKVSPACDNCYAEAMNNRFGGGNWGPKAPRKRTSEANWKKPLQWNRRATMQAPNPRDEAIKALAEALRKAYQALDGYMPAPFAKTMIAETLAAVSSALGKMKGDGK